MIQMKLSEAAKITHAELQGKDVTFTGCSTDSRNIENDQMFIALCGEHFDGHDFIDAAKQHGASSFMLEKFPGDEISGIKVKDTRKAMGLLAQAWRQKFYIPLIAVTGSNGKTTVKEMLSCILSQHMPVHATSGNLNNDIGVPLTLFGLGEEHRYAVIEMGANNPGEIQWLSNVSRPDVAVITQCAPAHMEGFGSVEGVARAKAEIYADLGKEGTAIINADDEYADFWQDCSAESRQLTFAINNNADIRAENIEYNNDKYKTTFDLVTPQDQIKISLPLLGRHNVMNALAAAACANAVNISTDQIRDGLQSMQAVTGRMQFKQGLKGSRLIDDTYNANPASLNAALWVLNQFSGKKWLVLGDMGELGEQSCAFHSSSGEEARTTGVEKLFTLGELSKRASEAFGEGAIHFDTHEHLIDYLQNIIEGDTTLLIKGSRALQMERVVIALEEHI